jgi:glycosyltransferase involved in cell wall biosynthesis
MRIAYLVPGSGGTFYCQNCMRDNELVKTLRDRGHDVLMVPLYLPLSVEKSELNHNTPVFYGAINTYLKEILPLYRNAPLWLERLLDSQALLKWAAKKAGSTRAAGLEEMTISMLQGEEGNQATELDHLISWFQSEDKPDVVHLSNALLLGLARRIRRELNIPVVCTLEDENEWIDPMNTDYQQLVWQKMAERAIDVNAFIAVSNYYGKKMQEYLHIPSQKLHVVYNGLDVKAYQPSSLSFDPPVIGYLFRMSESFGFGILIEAFIKLKSDSRFKELKLYATGGHSGDDHKFLKRMHKLLASHHLLDDVTFFPKFDQSSRIEFLRSLSVLSVPIPGGEAFGAYQMEALAAGVPLVQPKAGGFTEFVKKTGGGILYEPNDAETLASSLSSLLLDPERARKLGKKGRETVLKNYTVEQMTDKILGIYGSVINENR